MRHYLRDTLQAIPLAEMKFLTCIRGEVLKVADEFERCNLIEFGTRQEYLLSPPIVVGMSS